MRFVDIPSRLVRTGSRAVAVFICILCLVIQVRAAGSEAPDNVTGAAARAIDLFDNGRFSEAEHLALKTLAGPDTLSRFERSELYKLLAFISIANEDEGNAVRQFVEALRFNPEMSPDPVTWSPKVRRVFEKARDEYELKLQELRRRSFAAEASRCRRASLRSLYLPGAGQFIKGRKRKGIILGVAFGGTLASHIYARTLRADARRQYEAAALPNEAARKWEDYRNANYLVNITGLIAVSIYAYAFFDALWSKPATGEKTEYVFE